MPAGLLCFETSPRWRRHCGGAPIVPAAKAQGRGEAAGHMAHMRVRGLNCRRLFRYAGRSFTTMLKVCHDRCALLDHAERPQDHDFSRGSRAALQAFPGQYRQGRAVQGGVPGDLAEQPHSRDRRSRTGRWRQAGLGVRVRRDPPLSRRQDRQVHRQGFARAHRRHRVAVLADGRIGSDGRASTIISATTRRRSFPTRSTVTATRSTASMA